MEACREIDVKSWERRVVKLAVRRGRSGGLGLKIASVSFGWCLYIVHVHGNLGGQGSIEVRAISTFIKNYYD